MTYVEAIERLERISCDIPVYTAEDDAPEDIVESLNADREAIQMGILALKAWKL